MFYILALKIYKLFKNLKVTISILSFLTVPRLEKKCNSTKGGEEEYRKKFCSRKFQQSSRLKNYLRPRNFYSICISHNVFLVIDLLISASSIYLETVCILNMFSHFCKLENEKSELF